MKYEIHDKEPEFKPFSVTLTFETSDELERFEAFANVESFVPMDLWRDIKRRLGSIPGEDDLKYTCEINSR